MGYSASRSNGSLPFTLMLADMTSSIAPLAFEPRVSALLREVGLPTEDLEPPSKVRFYGVATELEVLGVVGLELFGEVGLLRSLAVSPKHQSNSLGSRLVSHAERAASESGVESLYLLTTTAERFFERRGYLLADRGEAPNAISTTRQFSGLCPASSAFMVKRRVAQRTGAASRDT